MKAKGLPICGIEAGSPAEALGLAAGDEILSVNGHPTPDELALKFFLADEQVRLDVRKSDGTRVLFELDLPHGDSLGVEVGEFRTRTCSNACLFCFINQLPPGARASLRIKDDDYRLSFLHGNYITLTNLPERELDRIVEQALSPLYVSVHATEVDLRTRILGRRRADDLAGKLRKLIDGGIRLHTQVVLMPGINDGGHLENTVFDLYGYHPGVDSVAIVPLGLSDHGPPKDSFTPVTAGYCREVVAQVAPWQAVFRRETGRTFAYLADEFYLQGGMALPGEAHYDDFAQIEDGVGMVRKFLSDFESEIRRCRKPGPALHGTLITGTLFYPVLSGCITRLNNRIGSHLMPIAAQNRFMGSSITVAGLLAGRDIADALTTVDPGDFVIIPSEAVSRTEGILVDDLSLEDLARRIGKPVYTSGRTMRDFFRLLRSGLWTGPRRQGPGKRRKHLQSRPKAV
jgi:putative radical SAM enzyme (TIGR03279 family)